MADNKDKRDTGFFWNSKYRPNKVGTSGYISNFVDATDALANCGFTISFQHIPSGEAVFFKAFVTTLTETYTSDWGGNPVFGRTDPIYAFKNTTRSITLNFKVPASSEGEAYENMGRIQMLSQFLYPTYNKSLAGRNEAQMITQSPLIRLKVMNLIQKTDGISSHADQLISEDKEYLYDNYRTYGGSSSGLLGVITSCTINHNIENTDYGVFEKGGKIMRNAKSRDVPSPGTILPKMIDVAISFSPIHEYTAGWSVDGTSIDGRFPYGVELAQKTEKQEDQTWHQRVEELRNKELKRDMSQAMIDNAKARYSGMFGKARLKRDQKRLSEGKIKSKEKRAYIAGTVAGASHSGYAEGGIDGSEADHMIGHARDYYKGD